MGFLFINVNHDVGYESSESIPISMGYILASLKARAWSGAILDDLRDRPLTLKNLEKWIRRVDPQVIGFTAYQSTMNRIRFLTRYIKSRHRGIHIALGGPQAVLMPSGALEHLEDVDILVRGEGEVVSLELAEALAAGRNVSSVDGITCRCDGKILDTGDGPEQPENLDAYPSPYLSGVLNLHGKNTAILLSSRGCRHVCLFCITPRICRRMIRYHSVERVLEEMDMLSKQGIQRFWFADPNFTGDRERTERLLEEKMRRGITTPFWCQTRADLVDGPLLTLLSKAGADTIAYGLESGSPAVLEKTNKRIQLEQLSQNIAFAQSLGLETELFSIFGLPGETVADARRTLEFVRSQEISVESNSGSQQMQLYFGSAYERNPERFGITALAGYRPRYLSVGEAYETDRMSRADIKKIRNMWSLANEQIKRDVYYKQRVFEVLDFLLENREDLEDQQLFYIYGALACSAIEEFELLRQFLEGYEEVRSQDDSTVQELICSLSFFKQTGQPAGPADRVIFDSRSYMDGVPFTGISGKFWDVLLGRGLLLSSFEEGFVGVKEGTETRFSFVFPMDYGEEDLRGRQVEVQAKIHKVFRLVEAENIEDVRKLEINNRYDFQDLDLLRDHNEILYYLTLRDSNPSELLKKPSHFLMFVHRLAKLGKREEVRKLAAMLQGKPTALNALADTLSGAGKCSWALEYYECIPGDLRSTVPKRVRCLLNMDAPQEALRLLDTIPETPSLEFQDTLLQCLKAAQPDSQRIPALDRHVLDLRVKASLEREAVSKSGQFSPPPIVHGHDDTGSL